MDLLVQTIVTVATAVFYNSLKTSVLIALVLLVQKTLRRFLSAYSLYLLWFTVVISLITPVGFKTMMPDSVLFLQQQVLPTPDMQQSASTSANGNALTPERFSKPVVTQVQASQSSTSKHDSPIVQVKTVSRIAWRSLLSVVWLAGVVLMLVAVLVQYFRFASLVRQALPANADLQQLLELCRQQTNCKTTIRLLCSPAIEAPLVTGCFSPVLLLPAGIDQQLSTTQLRHVFLHELMHVKHLDIASNWLLTLLQCLHWFNPLLWYGFNQMRHDRELACDAATLHHLGRDDRQAYGHTLLQLSQPQTRQFIPTHGIGIVDTKSQLRRRLSMIMQTSSPTRMQAAPTALLLLVFGGLAFSKPVIDTQSAASQSPVALVAAEAIAAGQPPHALAEPAVEPKHGQQDVPVALPVPQRGNSKPVSATARVTAIPEKSPVASAPPTMETQAATLVAMADNGPQRADAAASGTTTPLAETTYAGWEAIEQLSVSISQLQLASAKSLAAWNAIAATCTHTTSHVSRVANAACEVTMGTRSSEVTNFWKQCLVLADQYNKLTREYSKAEASEFANQVVIKKTILKNYQDLKEFCNAENYKKNYPEFAKLFNWATGDFRVNRSEYVDQSMHSNGTLGYVPLQTDEARMQSMSGTRR